MFIEIARNFTPTINDFCPYATISDRWAWEELDCEWREKAILLGESYLNYQYPYITATDFIEFKRSGNRVKFEKKSFSKRHALNALVLAECTENKGRFLDDIVNGIFSICEESAWWLPAHNSYVRDTPQLPLPDSSRPVLDLFACETGAVLACVSYLMGSVLDDISPFITMRIQNELEKRIFTPYLNEYFWWMGDGKEPLNNWTIWCTQNILLSVFLTRQSDELKHQVFLKSCQSVDFFLKEYGEDGCCDEGAQYYRHAGLCLFNTMEILNSITNNAFEKLYTNTKIRNIATYILNVHVDDKYYVNFSDCSPVAGRAGCREFLFAKRIQNDDMACFASNDFKLGMPDTLLLPLENNLFYRLQNAFTVAEIKAYDTSMPIQHSDIYYESVGLFAVRDEHFFLAVKAGDNADSHNHNDTGSFTIYKDGMPFIIDVGVESYSKKTFSPERYDIWTMQSAYHNLPLINGYMQKDGEEYQAKEVRYKLGSSICEIEMDISSAYPKECNLLSYKRHVILNKGKNITIQDNFTFKANMDSPISATQVILNLMTYDKPTVIKSDLHNSTIAVGTLGAITIEGGSVVQTEEIPITDPRLMIAWQHSIYRTQIHARNHSLKITIT